VKAQVASSVSDVPASTNRSYLDVIESNAIRTVDLLAPLTEEVVELVHPRASPPADSARHRG
jgi:hypothetical protein